MYIYIYVNNINNVYDVSLTLYWHMPLALVWLNMHNVWVFIRNETILQILIDKSHTNNEYWRFCKLIFAINNKNYFIKAIAWNEVKGQLPVVFSCNHTFLDEVPF
jgi:5'(3')-deoxyribonucleotidase